MSGENILKLNTVRCDFVVFSSQDKYRSVHRFDPSPVSCSVTRELPQSEWQRPGVTTVTIEYRLDDQLNLLKTWKVWGNCLKPDTGVPLLCIVTRVTI